MAASAPATNSTETVTVACKLPHGLALRVFDTVDVDEPILGGGVRRSKIAQERPERFVVNGFAHPQNRNPRCEIFGAMQMPNGSLNGGYALTPGVPKDLWEMWLAQNAKSLLVKNGLIFAVPKVEDARVEADKRKTIKSNLERLDPDNLPKGVGVRTDTEAMAKRQNEAVAR
jgi:hypothetical protein